MARKRSKKSTTPAKKVKKLPKHNKKCVVCRSHAHWEAKKQGYYPLLCDHCLNQLPSPSDALDDYNYIG